MIYMILRHAACTQKYTALILEAATTNKLAHNGGRRNLFVADRQEIMDEL
jgi:hypothetical protein